MSDPVTAALLLVGPLVALSSMLLKWFVSVNAESKAIQTASQNKEASARLRKLRTQLDANPGDTERLLKLVQELNKIVAESNLSAAQSAALHAAINQRSKTAQSFYVRTLLSEMTPPSASSPSTSASPKLLAAAKPRASKRKRVLQPRSTRSK